MSAVICERRGWIVGATVLVTLLVAGSAVGAATAGPTTVSVTSTSVSAEEPSTGETVIVTPTISHSSEGSGSFEVTEVRLVDSTGQQHAEADDLGALGAGDTMEVPLGASFASGGDKRLTIHVRGKQYDDDGSFVRSVHLTHPAYVSVSAPSAPTETPPQVHVSTDRAVAGAETTVEVTVSNGGDEKLTDLSVRLETLDGEMPSRTAITPVLAAENATTFRFDVTPPKPGEGTLKATLRYGDGNSVEAFEVVDVEPLRDEVSVYAILAERNESLHVQYRVTNRGNAPIRDVTVSGGSGDGALPMATLPTVAPESSETVTVELNDRPADRTTIRADYEVGGEPGEAERTVAFDGDDAETGAEAAASASVEDASVFGPSTFLTGVLVGGVVVTGLLFGYRQWRTGRDD
jgi:hypothetical protein